jgi:hypothetical protein
LFLSLSAIMKRRSLTLMDIAADRAASRPAGWQVTMLVRVTTIATADQGQ